MQALRQKEYMGDGVYAAVNRYGQLVLTTEDGPTPEPTNTIYLEPEVLRALLQYVREGEL